MAADDGAFAVDDRADRVQDGEDGDSRFADLPERSALPGRSATVGKTFAYEEGEPAGQGGAFRQISEARVAVSPS